MSSAIYQFEHENTTMDDALFSRDHVVHFKQQIAITGINWLHRVQYWLKNRRYYISVFVLESVLVCDIWYQRWGLKCHSGRWAICITMGRWAFCTNMGGGGTSVSLWGRWVICITMWEVGHLYHYGGEVDHLYHYGGGGSSVSLWGEVDHLYHYGGGICTTMGGGGSSVSLWGGICITMGGGGAIWYHYGGRGRWAICITMGGHLYHYGEVGHLYHYGEVDHLYHYRREASPVQ